MRLIVLNDHGYVNGGAAQVAISSLNVLVKAGLDVTFISSVGPVDPSINHDRIKVINFGFYDLLSNPSKVNAAFHGIWDRRCAKRFEDILCTFDPADTIIHLHTWIKSLSASVVYEAMRRGFKMVCTLHDYFLICPNGGLYNYQQKKLCNRIPMSLACILTHCDSRSYSQKLWRIARQIVQRKYAHMPGGVSNYITISNYSESILRKWLPRNAKFYRVNNPIDIEKAPLSDTKNNKAFTFVGRLSPEKGAAFFAAAAAPISNLKTVFVGSGSEERIIREINPHAELLGWQEHTGVITAIRSSRAIVFPSFWHETQGLVVKEAAALGIPAIVSDACAARDSIIDGKTGLLFRSGNINDLTSKLLLLDSDKQLASNLGKSAYNHYWATPCTQERYASKLIHCYEDILASNDRDIL